jgi:hypothetical protein
LSWCVPRNKCSGLTQERTSHLCSTCMPSGIGPWNRCHDRRCAWRGSRPPCRPASP